MVVCLGGQSSAVVTQKQNETLKHTCSNLCAYFYTGTYTRSLHGLSSGPNGNFSSRNKRNECSALKQRRGPAKGAKALKISMSVARLEKLVPWLCPEDRVANTTMTPPSAALKINLRLLHLPILFVCLCVCSSVHPSTRPGTVRSLQ